MICTLLDIVGNKSCDLLGEQSEIKQELEYNVRLVNSSVNYLQTKSSDKLGRTSTNSLGTKNK